ncbi:cobalamin biosynthesis protein CbiM [Brucella anthropi]|uniref:cobalamin biosynthesis protein CbiM n=1 Tax=Brucella anthropi TaxID=529 RepID=UPI00398694DF
MKTLRLLLSLIVATMCFATAAEAHRLKLFATVEGGTVHGYGFFIGGGRLSEAQLTIRNAQGVELFKGPANADGSFSFTPAVPSDLVLTIDAGDGHVAETHIAADRFPRDGVPGVIGSARAETPPAAAREAAAPPSPEELSVMIDRSVDRAVSRQIAPLLEAYAEADGRARFSDIVSGIAVIIGLAGLLLWAKSRRHTGHSDRQREP